MSSLESAKRKAKNSIEKRYFDAFRKPDAKEGKEVVLPNEVKAQMEKEIADATAKIEPYIGDGNLRIIYEKHEFLVKVRNPDTQTGKYQQEALKCGIKYCRIVRSWVGTKWKYLNRKLAAVRKTEHYILANELLSYGNEFVVEDMNYKALQKRSKKTKINPKTGRAHTKKRFGKSIGRCAPALFITILGQKASRYGGSVIKVSTFETKASQFDHTDDSYTKKKLSQRFAKLSDGTIVQRDLYSAFLLLHLRKNLQSYSKKTIKKDFPQFKRLHDETKERLKNSHDWLPSSVGF